MKCSNCQHENPEAAKFCNGCGHKLDFDCPTCRKANPPGSRFCNKCGQDLTSPKAKPLINYAHPQSYTPKHLAEKILTTRYAIEGERKLVTVMFAHTANAFSEKGFSPVKLQFNA